MKTVAKNVHVTDPSGKAIVVAPGDPIPDWLLPVLEENPKVIVNDDRSSAATANPVAPTSLEETSSLDPDGGEVDAPVVAASTEPSKKAARPKG